MKLTDLMRDYFDREITDISPSSQLLKEEKLPVNVKPGIDWEIQKFPNRMIKKFKFKKRKHLFNFIEDVLEYENENQHHGEITIRYKTVTVKVWTHDLNDITDVDIEYARTLNEIYKDSNASIDE
jgi:4a-hydroxytetrahydrobiopterin dehydratase